MERNVTRLDAELNVSNNLGENLMDRTHVVRMDKNFRYMKYAYDISRPFFLPGRRSAAAPPFWRERGAERY